MGQSREVRIRRWQAGDEVSPITAMLHRAYAELAALGLRYVATDQSDDVTAQRLQNGVSWVAEADGAVVGTISLCPWTFLSQPAKAYQRPGLWLFYQFGVEPARQRAGIGSALMEVAEQHAQSEGASEIACDTAVGATHLISLYERKGFAIVGTADFEETNYESVILVKNLGEATGAL